MSQQKPSRIAGPLPALLAALTCLILNPAQAAPPMSQAPSDQLEQAAHAVNAFGFDLWAHIGPGNQTLSPASIAIALDMTLAGARGDTARQMARVLHLKGDDGAQQAAAQALLARWRAMGEQLAIANRLFLERSYRLEPPFVEAMRDGYQAPVEQLDFADAPGPARTRINAWVAEQTRDRILDLIPPGGIDRDTRLVLTNAIYLLADWARPFEANATRPEPFHINGTNAVPVPTMHARRHARVGETRGEKLLELGYRDTELAMLFVLPNARDGLAELEAGLDAGRLDAWDAALGGQEAVITLPKFRVAPPASFELAKPLKALGMTDAFDPRRADFTAMADPPSPADRLLIDQVFHKAFVEVDEAGTEAAAATAVVMMRALAMPTPGEPFVFRADHPFLFLLRDSATGAVLFIGRVTDPRRR